MSSKRLDRTSLMRASLASEKKVVGDRFAAAEEEIQRRGGVPPVIAAVDSLPPPTPTAVAAAATFSAESGDLVVDPATGKTFIRALLKIVHDNIYNARGSYDPEIVEKRAASIAVNGQRVPAPAVPHPDKPGEFMLIDGHYRKLGLIKLGLPYILLDVLPMPKTKLDLYILSFQYNDDREEQGVLDDAFAWKKLLDDKVAESETQIAEVRGLSLSNVNKTLALLKLPTSVLDVIRSKPKAFGLTISYELSVLASTAEEDVVLAFAERIHKEELSSRAVTELRPKLMSDTQRKRNANSRKYPLKHAGAQVGSLKEWDNGKVAFEIVLTDPEERSKLMAELMARFEVNH